MAETIEAPTLPSAETDIDKMDAIREKESGKAKPAEKQDLDLGKGEDIPNPETPTEKPAEKPAEAPAPTEPETKPEEKKPDEKKPKKPKFWKKEPPVVPATNGEIKPTAETKTEPPAAEFKLPKDIQDRLEKAEALLNDPSVKLVLKAKESGKDFRSYYDEISSRDPLKIANVDVYKMQLDDVGGYTEAEKQRKVEKFMEKDEDDQADIIAPFRKSLKDRDDKEQNEWTPKFEQEANPLEMVWSTLEKAVPEVGKEYVGKELYGIVVTPERYKSAIDLSKPIVNKGADGNPDPKDFFEKKFLFENFEAIAETIADTNWLTAVDKLEEVITLPLSSESGNHTPQPRQLRTEDEKRIKDLADSLPK